MAVDLVLERCPLRASLRVRGGEVALFHSTRAPSGADTQMGGEVDDMDAAMEELSARGVVFEEYDTPELTTVNGIAEIDGNYPSKGVGERGAWVYDSEGNPLGIGLPARAPGREP